jgi:hypothetical protein
LGQATIQIDMSNLIHDVMNDPHEYLPFLFMLGGFLLLWAGLCVSGFISVRAPTRQRRFWFAVPPLLIGSVCVLAQTPVSMEAQGFRLSFDLRWLFLVPLLAGLAGLALWWRARHEDVAQRVA